MLDVGCWILDIGISLSQGSIGRRKELVMAREWIAHDEGELDKFGPGLGNCWKLKAER